MNHPKYFTYHGYLVEYAENGDVHITYYWTDSQGNDRSWSECRRALGGLRFGEPRLSQEQRPPTKS